MKLAGPSNGVVTPSTTQKSSVPSAGPSEQRKPLEERWTVQGDAYSSTADLVAHRENLDGLQATYQFRTKSNAAPFTQKEKVQNAVGVACQDAVAGGLAGGVGSIFIAGAAGFGDLLNALGGGQVRGVSGMVLAAPVVLGALIGAGVGAHKGYHAEGPEMDGQVHGVLKNNGDHLHFYANGDVQRDVDLSEFQSAPVASPKPKSQEGSGVVGNTLMGAAAAAATVPLLFVPLVGLGGGAVAGAAAGEALEDRTALGSGLGLALGAATTVGAIVAANLYGTKALAYAAAGLAVVGGALGHAVFTGMNRKESYDFGNQWWNNKAA